MTPAIQYHASTKVEGCQAGGLSHLLQYMREYNAERPKQDSKRFNSHGRRNTLPMWVYCLSMVWVLHVSFYLYFRLSPHCLTEEVKKERKIMKEIL